MIPVIFENEKQFVDARTLHRFLKVGRDFSHWIKGRFEEYGFEEANDYIIKSFDSPDLANQKKQQGGDRRSINYLLTLDTAKELAMVERTEVGKQVRRYFIEVEKQYMEKFGQYGQRLVFGREVRFVKMAGGSRFFSLADLVKSKRLGSRSYRVLRENATKMQIVGSPGKVLCVPESAVGFIQTKGFAKL